MNMILIAAVAAGLIVFPSLIVALRVLLFGTTLKIEFFFNPVLGRFAICIDQLSAFFLVVIAVMGLMAAIYMNGYLKPYREKGKRVGSHLFFFLLLLASMELVVTCSFGLMFLVFWEIMSLSSFFLVIFENEKKEVLNAGIHYLVFMHVSVLFIIASFALFESRGPLPVVFLLAFFGFGIKAGFFPFHNWLPEAHPAAPSHISGLMSGVMIKTGIYGILRTIDMIGVPERWLAYTVLIVASVTGLYGILHAVTQRDLKRVLAASSIENMGVIGIGIGVGMLGISYGSQLVTFLGFAGALFHVFNHSLFKGLLFFAAGNVYLKTHTRNIESLGGLIKTMPVTGALFLVASIAICGLPPLNGFISEFLIYFGIIRGLGIFSFNAITVLMFALASLALIGTMAILCFSRMFSITFLGMPRTEAAVIEKKSSGKAVILPMSILAMLIITVGMFPQLFIGFVAGPVNQFAGFVPPAEAFSVMETLSVISVVAVTFIAVVALLVRIKLVYMKKHASSYETWGCGYDRPDPRMQYTASSYGKPLVSVLGPLFKKVFNIARPKKLFPHSAHYESSMLDIEEIYVLNPMLKGSLSFLSRFEKIQNGNLQHYIMYGLGFLVLIILGLFWF